MAQSKNTRSRKPKLSTMERGHQMDGDRYVLGFAPALRFLRSQILCRLHKSPSDETVNRDPPSVYECKKITHARERYCSPCQWIMETPKTTQHAYRNTKNNTACTRSVRVFRMLDTTGKKKRQRRNVGQAISVPQCDVIRTLN